MGLSRRKFTRDFKLTAVRQVEQGAGIAQVARALQIDARILHRWRREFHRAPAEAFPGVGKRRPEERVAELERKIGQQALEIDFLRGCLQRIEEQRTLQAWTGKRLSVRKSRKT